MCETEAESAAYVLTPARPHVDASSISYIAGWSKADPTVLTNAVTSVLHAVNSIAAGLGLDDADEQPDATNVA